MSNSHWSTLQETTSVWGIKLLYWMFRLGGRLTFMLTLWPVVVGYWLCMPRLRAASNTYLQIAYKRGLFRSKPGIFQQLRHIFRFADTILDKILAVSGYFHAGDLEVHGLDALLSDPSGGILVTSHTGCLELCQTLRSRYSQRTIRVLVHTKHAEQFKRIIARINPDYHLDHVEVTELTPAVAIALEQHVAKGDFIVIAGDRTPVSSQATCTAPFMGREAYFPVGPYLLGTLLQCRVWSMICTRNNTNKARYALFFDEIWEPQPISRSQRQSHFARLAERFGHTLEKRLADSPYDWFNFFDFWQSAPSRNCPDKDNSGSVK